MNYTSLFKKWGIPIIIITAAFTILPDVFATYLGSTFAIFGQAAGIALSALVAGLALWFTRYFEKKLS